VYVNSVNEQDESGGGGGDLASPGMEQRDSDLHLGSICNILSKWMLNYFFFFFFFFCFKELFTVILSREIQKS
jgi:hypothetical protein